MGKSASGAGGRKQRQLKNLLLDRHFQLKYTGYLVAIAVALSASLGLVLFRTSAKVVQQSERSVSHGAQIVELGDEVVDESKKVSAVVRMTIVNDPVYQDDPDLLEAFNADAREQDKRLAAQKKSLEVQKKRLAQDARALKSFHRSLLWSLVGLLTALVLGIGLVGIVVTHKVAGPIFKMKRHLREVARGNLEVPWGLRKGDELVDFFEAFRDMIHALRDQRKQEIEVIDQCLSGLAGKVEEKDVASLKRMRDELKVGLD
jgi:methyl-accepting chemotaxis protein